MALFCRRRPLYLFDYFHRVELFFVQRNVLYVLVDPAYGEAFSAVDVYRAQQRHFEIAHDGWLDDVAIDEQRIESSLQVADAFSSISHLAGQQFHQAVFRFPLIFLLYV